MANPNGAPGLWLVTHSNGYDVTQDIQSMDYNQAFSPRPTMHQNTGIHQSVAGAQSPSMKLDGYRRSGNNALTLSAWEQLRTAGNTAATDPELIVAAVMGYGAAAQTGDRVVLYDGTLVTGPGSSLKPDDLIMLPAQLDPRGKRSCTGDSIFQYTGPSTQTSAFFDSNPNAYTLPTYGGVCVMEIITPTGAFATGTVTFSAAPADADTVTINGTVYTFKTSLTPTAGQVLIGATALATAQNLYAAMTGGYTSGVSYAAGTTTVPSTVNISLPSVSAVITFTYATTGTGGNAFTLAKSSTNIAVSAATLTGGTAGETATVTMTSATSSGGSYSTFATFVTTNGQRGAEWLEVAAGTVINRYIKCTVTMSGSSNVAVIFTHFARYWIA